MQDFRNKVAVITGGASGVGRSLAFAPGRRGAKIAVGDVDKTAMEQVRADLAGENIASIIEWCLNVNLWGVINSIRVFMPGLVARNEEAHFVVTGSGNGGGGLAKRRLLPAGDHPGDQRQNSRASGHDSHAQDTSAQQGGCRIQQTQQLQQLQQQQQQQQQFIGERI